MRPSLFTSAEPYLEMFRAFFISREAREQRALKILGAFLVFALFYGVWMLPMRSHLQSLRVEIQRDEKTLSWLKGADKVLSTSGAVHSSAILSSVDVLARLQQSIQASSFASNLSSLKQTDDKVIALQLNAISFDAFLPWLTRIETTLPIKIANLTIVRTNTAPGLVNINLKLMHTPA